MRPYLREGKLLRVLRDMWNKLKKKIKIVGISNMSDLDIIQNMALPGFPEVPLDAFEVFQLDIPPLIPPLRRTYTSYCLYCDGISHSFNPINRFSICHVCEIVCDMYATFIQSVFRGFVVRQKLLRLKKKELMHRLFMSRGYEGSDFARLITSFI